jgi:hypothetical protein
MAITTDLTHPIGQIRLYIGDSTENDGAKPHGINFTDAELTHFYDYSGRSVEGATALACETLAWLWSLEPDFSADGLSISHQTTAQTWWKAALRWRAAQGATVRQIQRREVDDAA